MIQIQDCFTETLNEIDSCVYLLNFIVDIFPYLCCVNCIIGRDQSESEWDYDYEKAIPVKKRTAKRIKKLIDNGEVDKAMVSSSFQTKQSFVTNRMHKATEVIELSSSESSSSKHHKNKRQKLSYQNGHDQMNHADGNDKASVNSKSHLSEKVVTQTKGNSIIYLKASQKSLNNLIKIKTMKTKKWLSSKMVNHAKLIE